MNIKEIQQLIKFVAKSGVSEVKIESKDLKLSVKTGASGNIVTHSEPVMINTQPVVQNLPLESTTESVSSQSVNIAEEDHLITIKSPIIGTFYRKPSPDKPNFIEIGDLISEGSVLCVVEAMKLFNEIESEYSGKIVKILVDDSSPVEFDQPLFVIDPS
ncbi:acetyl-CoA carboxylase biotin carboxyl carrier protein [Flavobacteriaceae bacterium]|nr:acetyl-CoA carboxylase biotin carboxyl carrier protein [Flavobacteriaceae bacterium]MDA8937587.1 acetyl-CoA carboxylase biotin carboxyl carrier protein [Flavobacteriaceae bacterium]MDA9124612.1 acetyl-CoA carboxylase biotin carboxyl carrier protein [Flavobacteriaceae bacterium]MDA9338584.1 acetyl-CoA carboxylase biotin carboxyl carrier protein [Flavobacteriaceae bacterium]MDB4113357.1 acetyl-CoA carboxylase biotin carboxyl carrier protein [Flavobacteriaceae bacterium]